MSGTIEQRIRSLITQGEGVSLEFKRAGGASSQASTDVLETVCSFANGFGGTVLLGVLDDGTLAGVGGDARELARNIANATNNPKLFNPIIEVETEAVRIDGHDLVHVWVPPSSSIVTYKKHAYQRRADTDQALHTTSQLADLAIRKYNTFTDKRVFPYLRVEDLRTDLIDRVRRLATSRHPGHPWAGTSDEELLRSAKLFETNYATGESGLTLAAALLLGTDEVIASVAPGYRTDVLIQVTDADRYDDRLICQTNLLDAYQQLIDYCAFRMPDPFYLEGTVRVSLRDILLREVIVNSLMHREYSSPMPARIIIDATSLTASNASKAAFLGPITPRTLNPITKNPLIAGVFRQIGLAEELGSGARTLFTYSQRYSGQLPTLEEGDIFRTRIPLPTVSPAQIAASDADATPLPGTSAQASGARTELAAPAAHASPSRDAARTVPHPLSQRSREEVPQVVEIARRQSGHITRRDLEARGFSRRTAQRLLRAALDAGALVAVGAGPSRAYRLA